MFRSGGTATVPDGTSQTSRLASDQAGHRRPTAKLPHGDHDSRTGRWPLNHAQRAPLRLNDTGRTEMASASGPFRRPLPSALTSTIFSSLTCPVVFSVCPSRFILWSVCRRAFLRLSDFVAREFHSHFGLFTAVASVRANGDKPRSPGEMFRRGGAVPLERGCRAECQTGRNNY